MTDSIRFSALLLACVSLIGVGCDSSETTYTGNVGGDFGYLTIGGQSAAGGSSSTGTNRGGSTSVTGNGGAATGTFAQKCASMCATAIGKACPADSGWTQSDCTTSCTELIVDMPECTTQLNAWVSCLASVPISSWICDSVDGVMPPETACPNEDAALTSCGGS